jgi:hypothetical protein
MAATDYSALPRAHGLQIRRVTLPAGAGDAREVILPDWCRRVEVYFTTSGGADADGSIATSGTDGSEQSSDAVPCPSGSSWELTLAAGGASIYLAGAAAGYAHLVLSRG